MARGIADQRPAVQARRILDSLGVGSLDGEIQSTTPIDGSPLGRVPISGGEEVGTAVEEAVACFGAWRLVPAPRRGELVRLFGEELRRHRSELGELITLEVGKIRAEGVGEVQEVIDVCAFAVGLSRQLYGRTMPSERPGHRILETWHPLGPVAMISAFNFPMAVWAWNVALALVCGDPVIWKPSERAPLCAEACLHLLRRAIDRFADGEDWRGLSAVVHGSRDVGQILAESADVPLVSATGSVAMGRSVGTAVARRLGRSLLELGGNNAMIVAPSADLDLAIRAITFAAVGTAGQRCTSLRRLIVHRRVMDPVVEGLRKAYSSLPVGDPRDMRTLVGPLIDDAAARAMAEALDRAVAQGGTIMCGGEQVRPDGVDGGAYMRPALVAMPAQTAIVREETFAPILHVIGYDDLDEAIHIHNDVPQGLSSSIMTTDLREAERFLSPAGSDCGVANVNAGPSGAEIGGAFGGEKETGGGRECGSDAWKGYMRCQTATVNWSRELPLAEGISFG